MSDSGDSLASGVQVASAVTGRVRLRAVGVAGREKLAAVAEATESWPEGTSAQLRPHSGSLIVSFHPERASAVTDWLHVLGVEFPARDPVAQGDPATVVGTTVSGVNRALARRLDGTDLRTLVPIGLSLLAARQAMRGNDRLTDAPWYVLAWYASETYMKFHGGATTSNSNRASKEE